MMTHGCAAMHSFTWTLWLVHLIAWLQKCSMAIIQIKQMCFHLASCFSQFLSEILSSSTTKPFTAHTRKFLELAKLALDMQWQGVMQTLRFNSHSMHKDPALCKGSLSMLCSTTKITAQALLTFITESQTSKKVWSSVVLGINNRRQLREGAVKLRNDVMVASFMTALPVIWNFE